MRDPYCAWTIEPVAELQRLSMEDRLHHLVSWGVSAANSHNSQPWSFSLDPARGAIHVAVDEAALLSESNAKGRQTAVSLGCALKTLRQAADAYGLQSQVDMFFRVGTPTEQRGHSPRRQAEDIARWVV